MVKLAGKKYVEVVKPSFLVFFREGSSEIILFFCLKFAGHETMIKMQGQGNFIFITTDSHIMN